jgi:hypothetical protein
MPSINTTIERDDAEIAVEVEYTYWSGSPGSREEPPDDPEIEIQSAIDTNGTRHELSAEEEERIEQFIWDDVAEREKEHAIGRADMERDYP